MTRISLPEDIALALEGFQQQAGVASRMLHTGERSPSDLSEAHAKMSRRPGATKTVYAYVKQSGVSVPDIDPQALLDWLMLKNDLHVFHLKDVPMHFSACRKVDGEEMYFITRFWGDVEGCCGMSEHLWEAEQMQREAHITGTLVECPDDHPARHQLLKDCLRPDLVSKVYLLEK